MALHEAGIQEAVAPMGTALTAEQVGLLGKLARRVVVVFDGDTAGKRAAEKAVPLFVDADLDGRVARLPTGQDPDDFVREQGAPAFRKLVEAGRPMLDQFIQDAAQETSVPGRIAALEAVAAMLVRVKDPTTQELYGKQTEVVLGLSRAQVSRALRDAREQAAAARARSQAARAGAMGLPEGVSKGGQEGAHQGIQTPGGGGRPTSATPAPEGSPGPRPASSVLERSLPRDELELLALLATYPDVASSEDATRAGDLLVDPAARNLFRTARAELVERGRLDVPAWLEAGPPDVRRSVMAALMDEGVSRAENPSTKLRALGARLELQRVEAEISMTLRMLGEARSRGDASATQAMIVRGIELDKTKQGLKAALQRP